MVAKPMVRVNWKKSGHGWTIGTVSYKKKTYYFDIKNFIEGSKFGIDNGCISKLQVYDPNAKEGQYKYGNLVMNYDRGWDVRPKTDDAKAILNAIKARFNNGMNADDLTNYKKYVW